MDIKIHVTQNKKAWIISFFISVYAIFGIMLDITETDINPLLKGEQIQTAFSKLRYYLQIAASNTRSMIPLYGIIAILLFFLIIYVLSQKYTVYEVVSAGIVGMAFSVCQWIGIVFNLSSWEQVNANKYLILRNMIYISGWWIVAMTALLFSVSVIRRLKETEGEKEDGISTGCLPFKSRRVLKVFLLSFLIIFICWLPTYIALLPGVMHGDVGMQVLQYHHFPTKFQKKWVSDGVNVVFTNDHPFIYTMLIGKFLDMGLAMGSMAIGVSAMGFCQMFCFVVAFSLLIASLYCFRTNRFLLKILVFIIAVCPLFPRYAIMIGADPFLALFFLCFMIAFLWIFQTKGAALKSKVFLIFVFFSVFMLGASKNQGIYIAIIGIFIVAVLFRKYWKQIAVGMVLPVVFFYVVYQGIIFSAFHVEKVGKQEALSFFFQQTARYVKTYEDEVTEEEKECIDKVLKYDILAKVYNPNLSDRVKSSFKPDATSEDLKNYFVTWAKMGMKHPKVYALAFISNTSLYYSPGYYKNVLAFYSQKGDMEHYYKKRIKWAKDTIPKEFVEKMSFDIPKELIPARRNIISYSRLFIHIPVLGWFCILGCSAWIMIYSFFLFWIRKDYKSILCYIPVLLVLGVCLLSPKNGNVRYFLPAMMFIPAMLIDAIDIRKDKKNEPNHNSEMEPV